MTSLPRFRSEFLLTKKMVGDVLRWFKSFVVLKHAKNELYFAVEIVNHPIRYSNSVRGTE